MRTQNPVAKFIFGEKSFEMNRWCGLAVLLMTFVCLSATHAQEFPTTPPPRNDIKIDNRVAIPMRDGVKLYADVYRPAVEGKYPVIVSRTP